MVPKRALDSWQNRTCPRGPFARWSPASIPLDSLAFLLITLLIGGLSAYGDEVSADRSKTHRQGDLTRRTYAGDVKAAFRSNIIQADSAVATSNSDQYRFYQNVRFADERYTVRANHLVYYTASGVARLFGDVTLSDGDRRLTADRVSSGRLSARGDVSAVRGDLKLTADRGYKQATPGVSSAGGSVHYVQVSADTLEVMAASAVVDDRYRFLSSVEVRQGAWSGSADQAIITDINTNQVAFR